LKKYEEREKMTNDHPWIDTKLTEEEMDFLWSAISEENKKDHSKLLAGNISKSEELIDKDNWFFTSILKKLTKRMFYRDWDNYYKYHIEKEEPPPEFEMNRFWVNYQKQHEFNPLHDHNGLYSFVVFMKIPTHWKDQHALANSANSNAPVASNFVFVSSKKNSESCFTINIPLSPENEGAILFFPATLKHMVWPFYECEEERITISGNIDFYDPNRPKESTEYQGSEYQVKKNVLKMMENQIKMTKEELRMMKKEKEYE